MHNNREHELGEVHPLSGDSSGEPAQWQRDTHCDPTTKARLRDKEALSSRCQADCWFSRARPSNESHLRLNAYRRSIALLVPVARKQPDQDRLVCLQANGQSEYELSSNRQWL